MKRFRWYVHMKVIMHPTPPDHNTINYTQKKKKNQPQLFVQLTGPAKEARDCRRWWSGSSVFGRRRTHWHHREIRGQRKGNLDLRLPRANPICDSSREPRSHRRRSTTAPPLALWNSSTDKKVVRVTVGDPRKVGFDPRITSGNAIDAAREPRRRMLVIATEEGVATIPMGDEF